MDTRSPDLPGIRLAVTGIALRNALGNTPEAIWQNAAAMQSGLSLVVPGPNDPPGLLADAASFIPGTNSYCDVIARMDHSATRQELGVAPHDFRLMSASTRLTLLLAGQAVEQAGLADAYAPDRVGVFVSQNSGESASTLWGLNLSVHVGRLLHYMEQETPLTPEQREHLRLNILRGSITPDEGSLLCRLNCTAAGFICQRYGFAGPSYSLGAACSSSLAALYSALTLIRSGVIDAAVVGGAEEAYSPLPLVEFAALGALAKRTETLREPSQCSRPFDVLRSGFILGEGAAMAVVERESSARTRKAPIHGIISSCVCATNTYGPVEASADIQISTMLSSFAGLSYGPQEVDLIECHATGTPQGDREEAFALKTLYGGKTTSGPVLAALKSQIGHNLGASGLSALIRGLLAMRHAVFPGTLNYERPDPALGLAEAGLRVLSAPEPWPSPASGVRRLQVNAFGFGGSCIVVQAEEEHSPMPSDSFSSASCGGYENASLSRTPDEGAHSEQRVDGVSLVSLTHRGEMWRMGSVDAGWRQELACLSPEPDEEELTALNRRGTRLRKESLPPPPALICCGQGSVYPGMGRKLYDAFPLIREAMDRIAAQADWDLLGLMDEKDPEKIILTRWQQPYLFLLEYAQAYYLQSLGLRPVVIAGHSLGELIALCLAGAYTPEGAWHILDGRSKVMNGLENGAQHDTGMMSVHAGREVIEQCLAEFPGLLISNYNTPTQFILSGPKDELQAASRALRKRRIPAMQLKVSLAFHHPGMRAVREISLKGLREVPMQGTRVPMLSNVTVDLYPDDAEGIREHILNLDENPVRWVECVNAMWDRFKVRHFVELGPGDTLCGLVGDIRPQALCIPAGRKGKEVENLRAAVAELYTLGHLPARVAYGSFTPSRSPKTVPSQVPAFGQSPLTASRPHSTPKNAPDKTLPVEPMPPHVEEIMPILTEATGFARHELEADMDLRHDLSLRSSRFPLLMHEVEKRFGLSLRFEDMIGVATIRDLASRIRDLREQPDRRTGQNDNNIEQIRVHGQSTEEVPSLLRYGLRLAPFAPPQGAPFAAQNILAVGHGDEFEAAAAFLRACSEADITLCRDPHTALAFARERAFDLLLSMPSAAPVTPQVREPIPELTAYFSLFQAFLRHREARFCLLAGSCEDETPAPVYHGCVGILLAAALECPNVSFRSVLFPTKKSSTTNPELWLAPALVPDRHFGQSPVQWILRDGTLLSPQFAPTPLDPGVALREKNMLRPKDVIVVSGGGRGITPRVLHACAALGCTLALLGRGDDPRRSGQGAQIEKLAALGAQVEYHVCDVSDFEAVRRVLHDIHARHGRIDGLIHAAGVTRDAHIDTLTPALFAECLAPKYRGAAHLVQNALPFGLRWATAFSSIAALCGNPGQAAYCAANQAMNALLGKLCKDRVRLRIFHLPPVTGTGMAEDEKIREAMRLRGMDKAFCDTEELAFLLARELSCSEQEDIIPARLLPRVPTLLPAAPAETKAEKIGLAPRPEDFPLLLPERCTIGKETTLEASCRFSHFRDLWLADARPRPDSRHARLLPSMLTARLMEGAIQSLPWLVPVGAENISFTPADCPAGVTREGTVLCRSVHAEREQALCRSELRLRAISANGRAEKNTVLCCSGDIRLAPSHEEILSLWNDVPSRPDAAPLLGSGEMKAWYAEHSGYGELLQLITDVYTLNAEQIFARMRIPPTSDIAGLKNSRYAFPVYPLEAIAQAALLLVMKCRHEHGVHDGYSISHIKTLRFSRSCTAGDVLYLEVRALLSGARTFEFDAEARNHEARPVLRVQSLCFAPE